ncbi:cobalt-precorrin 5A hydrolase [Roseiarcus fermentans]|uniref:Cobalt-precorrin 5A hydrolase n=1 Tax=Roseiarcus fermentans TaxID=1473586 RepID=A0A366ELT7_9HYPH|nr:cobalamin biosynthesis protein [Roseiarcus fermentans]RBP02439.1 cobalt-precorrin 5A hydrolase [Roseiarcus fermentans]
MSGRSAVGVGCKSDAGAEAIVRAVRRALARAPSPASAPTLHTSDRKSGDAALRQAALSLGLDLVFHNEATLATRDVEVVSRSARVEKIIGVGSLAEAAALVGAGAGSRLVVAKFSADGVSCAVAVAPEAIA